jgi:alpha-glucosidase (family GH31 glycosyl hydrolase)
LELKLERKGITNNIKAETVKNLKLIIKLAKNKARIQVTEISDDILNSSDHFVFPKNLLENEDLEFENDGKIDSLESSNIGVHIVNHPFSFYLYHKETGERLFDTTHSKESSNFDHYLYFARNYIQLSTRLPKGHYTYGLGERFSSLRLNKGKYIMWAADKTQGAPIDKDSNENSYSSMPSYITVNPEHNNAYGAVMLNSSPMEVQLEDDYLTYKLTSGSIDLYIFGGPRPREVIVQMQRTFGMPFVPSFDSLNWQANMITDNPSRDLMTLNQTVLNKDKPYNLNRYPVKDFWIDDNLPFNYNTTQEINNVIKSLKESGVKVFTYRRSPLAKSSSQFEAARNSTILITTDKGDILYGRTSYGDVCFIDYLAPNSLSFIKKGFIQEKDYDYDYSSVTLMKNEPSQNCDGECRQGYSSKIELPYIGGGDKKLNLEESTLPLSAKQYSGENSRNNTENILLNTHNLYSLQEMKTYYHALIDSGVKRPVIFSRSTFIGAQQYGGKWLGYLESSWKGLQMALVQTMKFNVKKN